MMRVVVLMASGSRPTVQWVGRGHMNASRGQADRTIAQLNQPAMARKRQIARPHMSYCRE
jgi:hypothetical protein